MARYEFRLYDAQARFVRTEIDDAKDDRAAKEKAGRWTKRCGGPVDLASADSGAEWSERYITTASPCDVRACGYRLERIVS